MITILLLFPLDGGLRGNPGGTWAFTDGGLLVDASVDEGGRFEAWFRAATDWELGMGLIWPLRSLLLFA